MESKGDERPLLIYVRYVREKKFKLETDYVRLRIEQIATDLYKLLFELNSEKDEEEERRERLRQSNCKIIIFPTGESLIKEEQKQIVKEESTAETAENDSPLFDEKEIKKMPQAFRKLFKTNKIKAHIRRRDDGRYEIRCQINKRKISASNMLLEIAKEKFIEKLNVIYNVRSAAALKNDDLMLENYMTNWLETIKKPYIKELTYKSYIQTATVHIYPIFGKKQLKELSTLEFQRVINDYYEKGRFRTAKKIYQLLSSLLDFAVNDGKIDRSPMKKVVLGTYEQNHGTSLTRDEEATLINALKANKSKLALQAFAFTLYTGLRRSELNSVEFSDDGQWISVITAKQRKGKKEKRRYIPVSPMLKKILPLIDLSRCLKVRTDYLTYEFKELFPTHHFHELRHTFITRCQECGIPRELVSVWAGHSSLNLTERVYTHLEQNKENQLAEILKFDYDF